LVEAIDQTLREIAGQIGPALPDLSLSPPPPAE
jgi:hypothetical protein